MATVSETILSFPGLEDTAEAFLEKTLLCRSLKGSAEYSPEIDKQVNLTAADIYASMVNANDFTEGKMTKAYSRDQFLSSAKRLYIDNGEPEKAAKLQVAQKKISIIGKAPKKW